MTSPFDTTEAIASSALDYRVIAPLGSIKFAGTHRPYHLESAVVEPYGAGSAGLVAYGGLRSLEEHSPLFAYHLRVNRNAQLVVSGRRPHPESSAFERRRLRGSWIYGGELMHHFGHFMAESSHRFYPLIDSGRAYDGVLFSARAIKPWHHDLITEIYGIPRSRVRFVTDHAAIVDELHVYPQGSILGGSVVAPGYADLLRRVQSSRASFDHLPKRVFLGRGHLTTGGGGVANEPEIAAAARAAGFAPVRPEEFSLAEQLALMANAEAIVMIGGSVVHLFDHLASSKARVFLVDRGDPDSFYHPRSLSDKVPSLERYVADETSGDSITQFDNGGRTAYLTQYEQGKLSERLNAFLRGTG